jgi:hypothetical protein
MTYAGISVFHVAGFVPCREGEEYYSQFDENQENRVTDWHEGSCVEGEFDWEKKKTMA